jgi:hypothetical protein
LIEPRPMISKFWLAEPRALMIRSRPPGGLEPPEPKVRRLAGGSPPTPIYDPHAYIPGDCPQLTRKKLGDCPRVLDLKSLASISTPHSMD